jgi:hypothetical protein
MGQTQPARKSKKLGVLLNKTSNYSIIRIFGNVAPDQAGSFLTVRPSIMVLVTMPLPDGSLKVVARDGKSD